MLKIPLLVAAAAVAVLLVAASNSSTEERAAKGEYLTAFVKCNLFKNQPT